MELNHVDLLLIQMMQSPPNRTKRWAEWILFASLLFTVPVPFFMLVVGGIVPLFYILYLSIQGLIVAIPKFTSEGFWMLGILWAHVAILGGILYVAAWVIIRVFFKIFPVRYAVFLVISLIAVLGFASTHNIYRMPGHNSSPPANITTIMKSLIN